MTEQKIDPLEAEAKAAAEKWGRTVPIGPESAPMQSFTEGYVAGASRKPGPLPTKEHHPVGAYLPVGQLDGDCSCGNGPWPCPALHEPAPDTDEHEALAMLIARRLPGVNGWLEADAILAAGFHRHPQRTESEPSDALSEKDLYDLPSGAIVMRSWKGMDPDIYEKRDGWWIELTNSYDGKAFVKESLGVVWSVAASFSVIWKPAAVTDQGGEQA